MKTRIFVILLFSSCCLFSCLDLHYKPKPLPQTIAFKVVDHSALFNNKNMSLSIDSLDHLIYFTLEIKDLKNFPFPCNARYKDTLDNTAFNFDFYYQGKPILSEYHTLHHAAWEVDTSANAHNLGVTSDTVCISSPTSINFQIPLYAFYNLKKGKQTIELNISQSVFTDDASDKNNDHELHLYETKPLLSAHVKFELNIPPIYKSMVYGYGLQLRNDSAFSPAGMDNTLWNSSYPDIYWMLYYPSDTYYTKTDYEKSTDQYTAHDTFNLYHYYANDSVGIGVFDHDYLSADDGLGYWVGPISRLSRHPVNRIKFGDVQYFDVKVLPKGIIN